MPLYETLTGNQFHFRYYRNFLNIKYFVHFISMGWKQYILLRTSIMLIDFTVIAKTDDTLSHINLKRDMQDPKHWLSYVNKSLEFTVMYALKRKIDFTCSFNEMRIYYSSFRHCVSTISYAQFPCKLQPETKTIPIILVKIRWYDNSCQKVVTMYKLILELDKQLTLNITFNKLITRDYFGTCNLHHLTVAFGTCGDKCFKYCGRLSHFSVFHMHL